MRELDVVSDLKEIKELLGRYEFLMSNPKNNYEGELTTLDEKDIDDIIYDMNMGSQSAIMTVEEDNKVFVRYPYNVCVLESKNELTK